MNEFGLAFASLATATPENETAVPGRKQILNRTAYLKNILHTCRTVDEVQAYVAQYDHSTLRGDVFIYTDRSGKYLVVEPFAVTPGTESKYVLANFCPSTITDFSTIKQQRFVNGTAFLATKAEANLAFCTALSDTMHVCRDKLGDGTLLTSIWDVNEGTVALYFYHDYNKPILFSLQDELAKGGHAIEIPALFPENGEYAQLVNFKTPLNSRAIDYFLRLCLVLFSISAVLYLFFWFRSGKTMPFALIHLLMVPLSLLLMYYMLVLAQNATIYFFPAPYSGSGSALIDAASYIPFLLAALLVPLLLLNRKIWQEASWGLLPRCVFTLNSAAYVLLVGLFTYWALFSVL